MTVSRPGSLVYFALDSSLLLLSALLSITPVILAQSNALLAQHLTTGSGHTSAYIITSLSLAYQLVNPLFSISNTNTASSAARANLYAQLTDVAFVSSVPTAAELSVYPNILTLPYTVVPTVVIYNLPTINSSVTLELAPQTLSLIFIGQVTWWNDSLIQADNPTLVLPQVPITVVLPQGPYTTSQILLDTLITQYPPLGSFINSSLSPHWPYQSYAKYILAPGLDGTSGAVLTQPYSIGYSLWAIAELNGNSITAQKNSAGNTVAISATTVQLGASEASTLQIQQIIARTNQQSAALTSLGSSGIELVAAAGQGSWPMLGMEYVVLDTQVSRTTCHARAGLIGFLVWLLTDSSAALVLSENMFGTVPSILLSQLDMIDQLETAVICRGTAAASLNTVASTDVQISVDRYLLNSQVLLAQTYNYNVTENAARTMTSQQLSLSTQGNPSSLVFDQMRFLEVSMGLLFPEQVDIALYMAYRLLEPPQFLMAPLFLRPVAPIYNRQLSANITLPATVPLNLTSLLIYQMLQGNVTSWLDPLVLRFNPYLTALAASLPQPQSAPVTQIVPCVAGPTSLLYFDRLFTQSSISDSALGSTDNYCAYGVPVLPYLQFVTDETKIQGAAQGNIGSFAYTLLTASILGMPTVGVAQLLSNVEQGRQTATGQTTNLPFISPTPQSMLACVEAGNAADWFTNLANSTSSSCWPMTTAVVAMLPLSYTTSTTTSNACTVGQFIYDYFITLYNTTDRDAVYHGQYMARAGEYESIRQMTDAQVQGVVCDGAALLGAKPAVWSLSTSVASFGYALSSVGLVVALAALLLIAVYLQHAVIAGAQPLLLAVHAAGCAVLLVSVIVLMQSVTTQSCSFLLWSWNVGSTLALAPLYCKAFRWYRMYGHGRHVHRVPNLHLYISLALAVTVDIAFTAAWQARAPLLPLLTGRTASGLETDYMQCGLEAGSVGTGFLVTAAFVKGGALLLFTVMAFTVRRVLISYKENVSVVYSLYNTCFALLLLVPITTLITAIGDVLIALLAILVLWIAIAPLLLLFAPKAAILLGVADGGHDSVNPVLSSAKSVSLGFSFLPVGAMSDDVLECYIKAVEAQVMDAKRRMGGGGKGDENDEASDAEDDVGQQSTGRRLGVNGSPVDVRRRTSSTNAGSGRGSPVQASRSHLSANRVPGQRS